MSVTPVGPLGGTASVLQPVIPTRFIRLGVQEQPKNHCGLQQVQDELFGNNLDAFLDPDGTDTTLKRILATRIIPEVSAQVVQQLNNPFDWCRAIHFVEGTGSPKLVLPYKNIAWVNVCFMRVLPSLPWYRFVRFRNVDGTEFQRIGLVEPPQDRPENIPPNILIPAKEQITTVQYTGIEDADMLVDTQRRMLIVPPRVLISGAFFPIWNYTFLPAGFPNIEIHFVFGFPPTQYENGNPIQFDPQTGIAIPYDASAARPELPAAQINWASGMPSGLTNGVARLVVNRLLRRKWRAQSDGLSSIGVDGASESYGGGPYSGDLDAEDKVIMQQLIAQYGIQMLV